MSKETFKEFISNINPESLEKTRKRMEEEIKKEAIEEVAKKYEHDLGYYECMNQWPKTAFIAGAEFMYEWMREEFAVMRKADIVDASVVESANPCSESRDKTYHYIAIVYEDTNKNIPYLQRGDKAKFIIIKDDEIRTP